MSNKFGLPLPTLTEASKEVQERLTAYFRASYQQQTRAPLHKHSRMQFLPRSPDPHAEMPGVRLCPQKCRMPFFFLQGNPSRLAANLDFMVIIFIGQLPAT